MTDKRMYPCQLAVSEKAMIVNKPLTSPISTGFPDTMRNSKVYQARFHCPITDRCCTYHYSQGTELEVVRYMAMRTLCRECVYKQRTEEEENERNKYKRRSGARF